MDDQRPLPPAPAKSEGIRVMSDQVSLFGLDHGVVTNAARTLPASIAEFITTSTDPTAARLCVAYAETFNQLGPTPIAHLLADNVTMGNQTHLGFNPRHGKQDVYAHIASQRANLRNARKGLQIRAELTWDPHQSGPAILLNVRRSHYGRPGLGDPEAFITLTADSAGQIAKIFTVECIPDPSLCRHTGLFPGLYPETIAADRAFQGPLITACDPVRFVLFTIPKYASLVDPLAAYAACLPQAELVVFDDPDAPKQQESLYVKTWPTLHLVYQDSSIRNLIGTFNLDRLHRRFDDIFEEPPR